MALQKFLYWPSFNVEVQQIESGKETLFSKFDLSNYKSSL